MQQPGNHGVPVHLQLGQDPRNLNGVGDVWLPRLAQLAIVALECNLQRIPVSQRHPAADHQRQSGLEQTLPVPSGGPSPDGGQVLSF